MPKFYFILFFLIILASFAVRVYNLNYNSPFNDEAVYIVVGKLQIFQKDFWSYNANAWMGGNSFFYPTASALAYVSGGIVGSRLLNVLFGVLAVMEVVLILALLRQRWQQKRKREQYQREIQERMEILDKLEEELSENKEEKLTDENFAEAEEDSPLLSTVFEPGFATKLEVKP